MYKGGIHMTSEQIRGKGVSFLRLRRITGYISKLHQFNTGKREEEKDRVKHTGVDLDDYKIL